MRPKWTPADFDRFQGNVGAGCSNLLDPLLTLLGPTNQAFHPEIGVGPGEAHPGPYDAEIAAGLSAQGWSELSTFTADEITLPMAAVAVRMLVPSTDAPLGKSPDAACGPILPNSIFPLHVDFQAYFDGAAVNGDAVAFDVPALDMNLDPPFDVDDHSHVPIIFAEDVDSLPARGRRRVARDDLRRRRQRLGALDGVHDPRVIGVASPRATRSRSVDSSRRCRPARAPRSTAKVEPSDAP